MRTAPGMFPSAMACWMIASTAARRTGDASAEAAMAAAAATEASRKSVAITRNNRGACAGKDARARSCWSMRIVRSLTRLRRVRDDTLEAVVGGVNKLVFEERT